MWRSRVTTSATVATSAAAVGTRPRPARFLGTHHPRLDDKGRLFLPAKFRDELAGGLVITPGQERCLYVFPAAEFARLFERIRAGAGHQQGGPRLPARCSCPVPRDETPDKQGRVTVPPPLRDYAGLTKDCVVIGAGTRLEVWDAQAWDPYLAGTRPRSPSSPRRCCPG